MANTKYVFIKGAIPYDLNEDDDMLAILGELNMPLSGLRLLWDREDQVSTPSKRGGVVRLMRFHLVGKQAIPWIDLKRIIDTIRRCGGRIDEARARDADEGGFVDLLQLRDLGTVKGISEG